jgi:hypothetical protein
VFGIARPLRSKGTASGGQEFATFRFMPRRSMLLHWLGSLFDVPPPPPRRHFSKYWDEQARRGSRLCR